MKQRIQHYNFFSNHKFKFNQEEEQKKTGIHLMTVHVMNSV
jgi:hypothetical protein